MQFRKRKIGQQQLFFLQIVRVVQVVQVVSVVRMISLGDMHSENIWFSCSKCFAFEGQRTNGGK